jgi:hypothetical protein
VTVAEHRAEAALALRQATDHIERAAVCAATARDHMCRADMPTRGAVKQVEAVIDFLADQRDLLSDERTELMSLCAEALTS